jgi:outer membrane protein TolC
VDELALRQAVEAALQNNPLLKGARLTVERERYRVTQAVAERVPRIALSETITRGNNPVFAFGSLLEQSRFGPANFDVQALNDPAALTNFRTAVAADLTVFDGRRTATRVAQADAGVEQAELANQFAEQRTRFDVISRYFGLALAETALAAASDALRLAEADLARARSRVDAGLSVESDVLAAQVQLAEFKHHQIRAEGDRITALASLNVAMGLSPVAVHRLTTELRQREFAVEETAQLLKKALANRLDYRQSHSAIEMAEYRLSEQRASALPEVRVFASAGYSSHRLIGGSADYTIGAGATFDVLDYGRGARVSQARVEKQLAEVEQSRIADQIAVEVVGAYYRFRSASQQTEVAESAWAQAREGLRIIQDRYEAGLTTITELLRAETAVVRARMNAAVARHDQYLSYANVLFVTGELNDVASLEK